MHLTTTCKHLPDTLPHWGKCCSMIDKVSNLVSGWPPENHMWLETHKRHQVNLHMDLNCQWNCNSVLLGVSGAAIHANPMNYDSLVTLTHNKKKRIKPVAICLGCKRVCIMYTDNTA